MIVQNGLRLDVIASATSSCVIDLDEVSIGVSGVTSGNNGPLVTVSQVTYKAKLTPTIACNQGLDGHFTASFYGIDVNGTNLGGGATISFTNIHLSPNQWTAKQTFTPSANIQLPSGSVKIGVSLSTWQNDPVGQGCSPSVNAKSDNTTVDGTLVFTTMEVKINGSNIDCDCNIKNIGGGNKNGGVDVAYSITVLQTKDLQTHVPLVTPIPHTISIAPSAMIPTSFDLNVGDSAAFNRTRSLPQDITISGNQYPIDTHFDISKVNAAATATWGTDSATDSAECSVP